MKKVILIGMVAALIGSLIGCSGSDSDVTKAQEEAFRNPPKGGMPDDIRKQMEDSKAKGAAMAEEARRKNEERNKAAAGGS